MSELSNIEPNELELYKSEGVVLEQLKLISKVIDTEVKAWEDKSTGEVIPPIEIAERKLNKLCSLLPNAAICKASAKALWRSKELEVLKRIILENERRERADKWSPTLINKMLQADSGEYEALFDYSDRIFAGASTTIDALRSVLSKYKTELEQGIN